MLSEGTGTIDWTAVGFECAPRPIVLKAKPLLTCAQIKERIAKHYRITVADLESPCRKREYARPRQIAMALAHRKLTKRGYSLSMIAKNFGGRHYSTVLFACKKFGFKPDPVMSERSRANRLRGYQRGQAA